MNILYSLVAFEWSGSAWKCMYSEKMNEKTYPSVIVLTSNALF